MNTVTGKLYHISELMSKNSDIVFSFIQDLRSFHDLDKKCDENDVFF